VLGLDEALQSEQVSARELVVEVDQPGAQQPVRLLGAPFKLSRTPADSTRPGPGLGDHTDEVLAAAGYSGEEIAALHEAGAVAGAAGETVQGSFMSSA
jgi:crotonobetainyl-CoA:carnitine CoA-transferase CaiB-like acyl-CoA transferase